MKQIKILVGFLVFLAFLVATSIPALSIQPEFPPLAFQWFKCKISVKGYSYDPDTGAYSKSNLSAPVYMYFAWMGIYSPLTYTGMNGSWTESSSSDVSSVELATGEPGIVFLPNLESRFGLSATDFLDTRYTPVITLKYKNGAFTKAILKGTGEVYYGYIGGKDYYGYFNISGTTVDESKVPFPH